MYHDTEAHSCNYCCCAKPISVTQPYSEQVFVALVIMHFIATCGLSSSMLVSLLSQTAQV